MVHTRVPGASHSVQYKHATCSEILSDSYPRPEVSGASPEGPPEAQLIWLIVFQKTVMGGTVFFLFGRASNEPRQSREGGS